MSLPTPWQMLKDALLDLFFPPRCVVCRAPGTWLCATCQGQISFVSPFDQHLSRNGPINSSVDGFYAVAYHEEVLREVIHAFKYSGVRVLATPLAELLAAFWRDYALAADALVPVPLHARRLRERGYNQSVLLANALGQAVDVPVRAHALQRVRHTLPQVGLGLQARQENVADAFACVEPMPGAYLVLIDDVCTTGATLSACALALKEQGARYVLALTLARARGGISGG